MFRTRVLFPTKVLVAGPLVPRQTSRVMNTTAADKLILAKKWYEAFDEQSIIRNYGKTVKYFAF